MRGFINRKSSTMINFIVFMIVLPPQCWTRSYVIKIVCFKKVRNIHSFNSNFRFYIFRENLFYSFIFISFWNHHPALPAYYHFIVLIKARWMDINNPISFIGCITRGNRSWYSMMNYVTVLKVFKKISTYLTHYLTPQSTRGAREVFWLHLHGGAQLTYRLPRLCLSL